MYTLSDNDDACGGAKWFWAALKSVVDASMYSSNAVLLVELSKKCDAVSLYIKLLLCISIYFCRVYAAYILSHFL